MALLTKQQLLMIVIFKICLPTFDIYSDIGTAYELLTWETVDWDHNRVRLTKLFKVLGFSTILFLVLNQLFTIPHYLRNETTWKKRLKALPFLLLFCWPQFKALEVLWIAYVTKDVETFEELQVAIDFEISQVETFLESIPQVHITLIVIASGVKGNFSHDVDSETRRKQVIVFTSFVISLISSAYGMSNVLKNGPVKLIKESAPFMIVALANGACLVGKAAWFFVITGSTYDDWQLIFVWLGLSILPNLILQMTLLLYHFGFKITSKFITRWPAIAILPCFGPFVFSGEDHDNKKVLTVSQMWTFVNTSLNISCSTFGIFLVFYLLLGGDGFCFLDLGFMCAGEISVVASIPLLGLSLILCIIIFCSERCCVITQRTGCHIVEDDSLVMVDLDSNKNNEEGLAMHNI